MSAVRGRSLPCLPIRTLTAVLAAGALAAGIAVPAAAVPDWPPPEPTGGLSQSALDAAVHPIDAAGSVRAIEVEGSVTELGDDREEEDGETTINLSTDLLFSANSWELPGNAPRRIAELVEEVPEGATVRVTGHTDSRPTGEGFDNQELSEHRAGAVAEALRSERGDLSLEVSGRGDSEPAEAEDPEDPATYEANRRVEITYTG